jgi:hypothetical protein
MGAMLPAIEKRLRVVVLSSGGFYTLGTYPPEANPFNFVPHVFQPVLMVNGRYDTSFPYDSCQRPLFVSRSCSVLVSRSSNRSSLRPVKRTPA